MQGIGAMLSRRAGLALAAATLGVLGSAGVASAATYTVNSTADAPNASGNSSCATSTGTCTLRAAVQAADANGGANTIVLPAGTYTYTIAPSGPGDTGDPATGDLDVQNNDQLTITGAGSGTTIINPNHLDRAFSVAGDGSSLSLSGVKIENGTAVTEPSNGNYCYYYTYVYNGVTYTYYETCGGAIQTLGKLTLSSDVVLSGNAANYGGAIQGDYTGSLPDLSATGATFTGNTALYDGGALLYAAGGRLMLAGDTFTTNSTTDGYGGGVAIEYASLAKLSNNLFSGNASSREGGGVYNASGADVTLNGNTFKDNTASRTGGGLSDEYSSAFTATDNLFTGNTATNAASTSPANGSGGGMYLDSCDTYNVNHDEFDGNAAGYGGGIYTYCALNSDGSSLIGNTASTDGGGIYFSSTRPTTLTNATITQNKAGVTGTSATVGYGGGIYFSSPTPIDMINDTLYQNSAVDGGAGGGMYETSYITPLTVGIENTVVAGSTGGDCADSGTKSQVPAGADAGYNMDSDGSCFNQSTDKKASPLLGAPASNGGPVTGSTGNTEQIQTDAELAGSPTIDAGTNSNCPATDAIGVARPQGASCDIGAIEYNTGNGQLSLTKTAPASAKPGSVFNYTITVGNKGPGNSTGTTITDQLPANTTLYGENESQGGCTSSGSPAKVTCALGTIAAGSSATVTIAVSVSQTGSVTNTASVTNDQGSSASGSATTSIAVPSKYLGKLVLDSRSLTVKHGRLYAKFTCKSSKSCVFRYSIGIHAKVKKTKKTATVVFLVARTTLKTIRAGKTVTVSSAVTPAGMALLKKASHHRLRGKLTTRPRTAQKGIIEIVSIHQK